MSAECIEFSGSCTRCARLARERKRIRAELPHYHALPVAAFGDPAPRLLVVGLAPGMHGANRTGRPFTGDHAGILLYETLHRFGFANKPEARSVNDGLRLQGCRITNAVKCWPPQNKPLPDEVRRCNVYLRQELAALPCGATVLALGAVAHQAVLTASALRRAAYPFAHGARHALPNGLILFDSYHCSRYNTQTGRLTADMFRKVFAAITKQLRAG